jgi:acyl-CoA reductase-like NAD-dependent aldehyde dehydrogenase
MNIVNPASGEIIATVNEDDSKSLAHKYLLLKSGQVAWASRSLDERIAVIEKFNLLLDEEKEQLAPVLTAEVGKPLQQSRNEINGARARVRWMLDHAVQYLSDETVTNGPDLKELISYEPLGVICNISAWNYPYLVGVNVFIPALLAGNAVMYKPSEYATLTGMEIEKLLKRAGVPDDVFKVAIGARETGSHLLYMNLTGTFLQDLTRLVNTFMNVWHPRWSPVSLNSAVKILYM